MRLTAGGFVVQHRGLKSIDGRQSEADGSRSLRAADITAPGRLQSLLQGSLLGRVPHPVLEEGLQVVGAVDGG